MFNILFATDFDKDAPGMLKYTALLAEKLASKIIMFHAFGTGQLLTKRELNEKGTAVLKKLHRLVEDTLPKGVQDVTIEYQVEKGFASEAIPELAAGENIDMVVMGMKHGSHSWDSLIGNTTLDILLKIDCAVLVIPEGFRTTQIKALGCTTDFKYKDIAMINMLREIGKSLGRSATIHCIHVFEKDESEDRVKKDIEVLYGIFADRPGTPVSFEIESGKRANTIEAFALRKELDLLVMNSHQRGFIGQFLGASTTREIAKGIQVPLLILKDL